jgi:transcriptional regulator with XRE-family HTH domain
MIELTQLREAHQVAEMLNISAATLAKWRCSRRGPSYLKIGRRAVYPMEDILIWMESQRKNVPAPAQQPAWRSAPGRQSSPQDNRITGYKTKADRRAEIGRR